jgi:MATE family multidrug resistance protein
VDRDWKFFVSESSSQFSDPSDTGLGWADQPMPELIRLGWPIIVSMLSASVMTLVDTVMVSRLGSYALAGVGLGGIVNFIVICFPIGLLGGVKILISQAVGAGQHDSVQAYLGSGIWLAIVIAAIATPVALAIAIMLPAVSASESAGEASSTYLGILAFGALPALVRIAIEQSRFAIGDSRSPMRVMLFANAANVALNYLFIFVLEMGVAGAAYGTLAAGVLGCMAMCSVQLREGMGLREASRHHLAGVWRLGLPSGIQFALEMGSFATMVVMLNHLSELDGAANQIAIQVLHFGFLPCMAMGEAATVLAGQAIGAGRRDLIRTVTRAALIPTIAYAVMAMFVFIAFGSTIIGSFTSEPELLLLGTRLLYVAAAFQVADGVNIVSRSVLRGTGDVRFCAWAGIVLSWLMTPPLTWLFAYHYGLGALGGWIGLCLDIFLTTTVFWLRLRGTRWHKAADASLAELAHERATVVPLAELHPTAQQREPLL